MRGNETFHQVGFWTQIHGFLDGFDFGSENFLLIKIVIITNKYHTQNVITKTTQQHNNNMQTT